MVILDRSSSHQIRCISSNKELGEGMAKKVNLRVFTVRLFVSRGPSCTIHQREAPIPNISFWRINAKLSQTFPSPPLWCGGCSFSQSCLNRFLLKTFRGPPSPCGVGCWLPPFGAEVILSPRPAGWVVLSFHNSEHYCC